jgi:hypothetical protein
VLKKYKRPRGELRGAQSERKGECVFETAERHTKTTCFGGAFSCLETKGFILRTKKN